MLGIEASRRERSPASGAETPPACALEAGEGLRHALSQVLDARPVGWMGRKELGRLPLARLRHVLPQRDALARIEAGSGHQVEPEQVRLALLLATEGQQDPDLCPEAEEREELLLLG